MFLDEGRIERLKAASFERRKHGGVSLDSTLFLDAYLENLDKSLLLREALAIRNLWVHQRLEIYDDELIIGRGSYEIFTQSYGCGLMVNRSDPRLHSETDETTILGEKIKKTAEYMTGNSRRRNFEPEEKDAMHAGLVSGNGWGGHMVTDHHKILRIGLKGVEEEVIARKKYSVGTSPEFFTAMKHTIKAIRTLISRYGENAIQLAEEIEDRNRANELREIGETCFWISGMPPRSFHEALQLTWFIHLVTGFDSFGRFDQYLWPFYERDRNSGRLTRDQAGILLQHLWLKVIEAGAIQNLTLGGLTEDGKDAINDLTYLCIETSRILECPQPNLSLRVWSGSPSTLLECALATIRLGVGVPALYNDDVIVRGLEELGIPSYEARNYALAGCSQVVIPGKSHFGCDDGVYNAAKCLELVLNNGVDPLTGKKIGLDTGAPDEFPDFDSLMIAFKKQVAYAADMLRRVCDASDKSFCDSYGDPIRTLFTQGCLLTGKGIWEGGALYNAIQTECIGITNAADSLAAIKKLVYEDGSYSLGQLVEILNRNWEGEESLVAYCKKRLPKLGNDDDYVDSIYREVAETVYSEIRKQPTRRGGVNIPGSVVFVYQTGYGRRTGATPDGRLAGEPLADSAGPSQGRDVKGPTAVLNSLCKFDQSLGTTCVILNMKFARNIFDSGKVRHLIRTYFDNGGMQLQINVVDADILRQAQERPHDFPHLIVRVGGFSAYFNELGKDVQNEIISRTAH